MRLHSGYTITRPVLSSGVDVTGLRCLQSNPPNTNINTLLLLYLLVIHLCIFSYSVLHKTAPCLSSLTLISARLLLSAPSLLRFSGGFCPFHAHCSPYSTVQHGWSDAAAESERTSGQRAKQIQSYVTGSAAELHTLDGTGQLAEITRKKGEVTAKLSVWHESINT